MMIPQFIELRKCFLEGIGYEAEGSTALLEDLFLLDSLNLPDFFLNSWLGGESSEVISSYLKHNEQTGNIPVILFSTLKHSVQHPLYRYADGFICILFEIN